MLLSNLRFFNRQRFIKPSNRDGLFLFNFLHFNSQDTLNLNELHNFGLLNLLRFNTEVHLDFPFRDDLLLFNTSQLYPFIHFDFPFLNRLFLRNPRFFDLLLHLIFPLLYALLHLELEFECICFSFCRIDRDIFLLVRFRPRLILFRLKLLDARFYINLDDCNLFFLNDLFFCTGLVRCNFSDCTDTNRIKTVLRVIRCKRCLIDTDNRYRFKRQSVLKFQILPTCALDLIRKLLSFL